MTNRKKSYRTWKNSSELAFIKSYSGTMKDEDLAVALNNSLGVSDITVSMVRRQRRKLLIVKKRGRLTNKVVQGESGAKIGQEGKGENNE
jgi:hypothetical protein